MDQEAKERDRATETAVQQGEQAEQAQDREDLNTAGEPIAAEAGASAGQPTPNSSASGLRADDEEAGEVRRKLYESGATLVSKVD
jgi:hypothetical protein